MKTWSPYAYEDHGDPAADMVPDKKGQWVSLRSAERLVKMAYQNGRAAAQREAFLRGVKIGRGISKISVVYTGKS